MIARGRLKGTSSAMYALKIGNKSGHSDLKCARAVFVASADIAPTTTLATVSGSGGLEILVGTIMF